MPENVSRSADVADIQRFVRAFIPAVLLVVSGPAVLAYLATPAGTTYLGYQFNTDDHMVYAAWMRQAMDGRFLFDNRFTTDDQPGLTIHLYFWVLGLVAKVTGIVLATHIARVAFTGVVLWQVHRFLLRMELRPFTHKLALMLVTVGSGVGFTVWHDFGQEIVRPAPEILRQIMLGRLPTDVWQPEGFLLASALTNSLFMVSLSLMLFILSSVLDARFSWKPVLPGALAMLVLMNIHSYDVLLLAFVLLGFLAMTIATSGASRDWVLRAVCIGLGALPAAFWFLHVLRSDEVFQFRAATETFSPNFRQIVFGYLPLLALGFAAFYAAVTDMPKRDRGWVGLGILIVLPLVLFGMATWHTQGYFLTSVSWGVVMVLAVAGLVLTARKEPAWNLMAAWAVIGVYAVYVPALFQRKLAMGLSIPWAILAALGLGFLLRNQERSARNLVTALLLLVAGAGSIRWVARDILLASKNVSSTTVHPVYLSSEVAEIVDAIDRESGRRVVLAVPGRPAPLVSTRTGHPIPDAFGPPAVPDLNPIVSGFTGAYTYAGHWSETPRYLERRGLIERFFFGDLSEVDRREIVTQSGATHIIALVPEAFPEADLPDLRDLGQVMIAGDKFLLLRVN